jgi:hypothetical protein
MVDDDLWWLYCGTECSGHFIGPFFDQAEADASVELSSCKHTHAEFRMTIMQMSQRLPITARLWTDGIWDARYTPTRLLIQRPRRPLEAHRRWPVFAAGLVTLKEWSTA